LAIHLHLFLGRALKTRAATVAGVMATATYSFGRDEEWQFQLGELIMSDEYVLKGKDLAIYPVGLREGDRLRLINPIVVRDHEERPTGQVYAVGEIWIVQSGSLQEPHVVWLQQADGSSHTWDDDDIFETFERVDGMA